MLELPSVTLVCLDADHHGLALAALEQTMLRCRFGDVVFFTDRPLPIEELRVVAVAAVAARDGRLRFLTRELPAQMRTPHVLLIGWDAFVVNPSAWDDAFLEYDYVAAEPVAEPKPGAESDAGNDGIALISTRLLRAIGEQPIDDNELLVGAVTRVIRGRPASEPAMRSAPRAVNDRFAFGERPPAGQPFAFRGLYNMWMFFQPADLDAFLQMATPAVLGSNALAALGVNLRDLDRPAEARAVFTAMLGAHPQHPVAREMNARLQPRPATGVAAIQPSLSARTSVGRNDACPCGSGRKYKQCHGNLAAAPAIVAPTTPPPVSPPPLRSAHASQSRAAAIPGYALTPHGDLAVLFNRAQAAFERNDLAAAEELYRAIVERDADNAVAIEYLGVIATKTRRYDEAEPLLTRAIELDASAPEFHNNFGLLRHAQGQFADAQPHYHRALAVKPDYAPAHNNLGLAFQESDRLDDAIACYRAAVVAKPDFADAHWNLGLSLILSGNFEEGLAEHEWRLKVAQHRVWWARRQQFPEWHGEPLQGKRILLLAEQGMGDTIQFVRYAQLLVERGATVIVEAASELIELLRTVPAVSELVPRDGPYPRCDFQVPIMSLPQRFGTRAETIPAPPKYLTADPARSARWARLLGPKNRPRIGIAWAGNPEQARDRYRSMALSYFAPLLAMPQYEWLGLQKGPATAQIAALPPTCRIRDMGRDSETFADLAALVELLDAVITIDTSIVHVAGALHKPTLLLLDAGHDWRWPRTGTDGRWYPTVHIVRQPARGDWAGAIRDAAIELERLLPHALHADATAVGTP